MGGRNITGKKYLKPLSHTTTLSLLTMNPLIIAIMRKEIINKISTVLRIVHAARKSRIKSMISCEIVLKGPIVLGPKMRSLTNPVHVASQKPMKKSRCKMNRTSNIMILAVDLHYLKCRCMAFTTLLFLLTVAITITRR